MRSSRSREPTIVVGTDGSDAARPALVWALAEAAARGARLDVVHAWSAPTGRPDLVVDEEIAAARALTGARAPTRGLTRQGNACEILLEHSTTADLLVLGAGGSGGRGERGIGSVTSRCLQRSTVPLAVIPVAARHRRNGSRARFSAEIGALEAMNPGARAAVPELAGLTRHPSELIATVAFGRPEVDVPALR